MTFLDFMYDKLHYLIDFRDSNLVCTNKICDFIKTDFGNFFINLLIIMFLANLSYHVYRKIFYLLR